MVKVNGLRLREALRRWRLRRDALSAEFAESKMVFAGDPEKPTPVEIMEDFEKCERSIAKLETAQARYNLSVAVQVGTESMTLTEAVKQVGGAGRMEKMWRSLVSPVKDRYGMRDTTRNKDEIVAQAAIPRAAALVNTNSAAVWASQLRSGIALGNVKEVEIDFSPELLK